MTPGAIWENVLAPAATAARLARSVTSPATKPATPPVSAPSTTKGPRTIQRGAPTSCMIATSFWRDMIAARMLFAVTVTATKPSRSRNAPPATPTIAITRWMRS